MTLSLLAAEQQEEPNPLGFNIAEFVLVLIIFGILLFLISKFVVPAFERAFDARREAIEGGIARAEQAQAEAARLLEQYNAQLAEARTEAAQIREGARAEAQRIVEQLRTQAQQKPAGRGARRGAAGGSAQPGGARTARPDRRSGGELSEKIVGQRLSDDAAIRGTVDAFLADIERADIERQQAGEQR